MLLLLVLLLVVVVVNGELTEGQDCEDENTDADEDDKNEEEQQEEEEAEEEEDNEGNVYVWCTTNINKQKNRITKVEAMQSRERTGNCMQQRIRTSTHV